MLCCVVVCGRVASCVVVCCDMMWNGVVCRGVLRYVVMWYVVSLHAVLGCVMVVYDVP